MDVRALLVAGQESIREPGTWCQGAQGLNAAGHYLAPDHPDVIRRCALGAIHQFTKVSSLIRDDAVKLLASVVPVDIPETLGYAKVAYFNNNRTHALVLQLFSDAIEAAPLAQAA